MLKLSKKVKRSNLEDLFDKAVKTHPDMSGHMHYLRDLASECEKVVEFGVYKGTGSTIAFISSDCSEYVGYDKNMYAILPEVRSAVAELNLKNNHSKVKKYIAMHDTHYYADCMNKDGAKDKLIFGVADKGLGHAINEFLDTHPEWKVKYHTDECHGLTVLERVE